MDYEGLGPNKKNARRWQAHLAFLDETGFCMTPTVRRTWGLRGRTPVLKHRASHYGKVSGIGALTISPQRKRLGSYLHLYPEADISQEAVVAFLRELLRHFGGVIIVVWDRLAQHRGAVVKQFVASHPRLQTEFLPPYAPELNPQDKCWANFKYHRLANHGITESEALADAVGREFLSIRSEQDLLRSFVRASDLPIRI